MNINEHENFFRSHDIILSGDLSLSFKSIQRTCRQHSEAAAGDGGRFCPRILQNDPDSKWRFSSAIKPAKIVRHHLAEPHLNIAVPVLPRISIPLMFAFFPVPSLRQSHHIRHLVGHETVRIVIVAS